MTFGDVEEGAPVGVATPGVLASCDGVSLVGSCVGEGGELLSVFCDGILPLPVTNGGREGMWMLGREKVKRLCVGMDGNLKVLYFPVGKD